MPLLSVLSEETVNGTSVVKYRLGGNFDVNKTFDCGQCFRFERVENSPHEVEYAGIAYGRAVSFGQDGDLLYVYNSTVEEFDGIWYHYLGLDMDYGAIDACLSDCCDSHAFAAAMECGRGIRILNQEPYEALISFIISQNNNIPRIKQIIERLCAWCGTPIETTAAMREKLSGHSSLCAFPTASALNKLGIDGLFEAKTGFRAKYIYDAVDKLLSGSVDMSAPFTFERTEDAVEYLCAIKGVGPKVASCVLLFSCEKYDAFPVDVWIKRAMTRYFPEGDFSPSVFGAYAGIAQQYLFYYERYLGGESDK